MWALPLLFLIPLLGYFLARHNEPRRDVAVQTTPAPRTEAVPRAIPEPARPVGTAGTTPALPMSYELHFNTGSQALTAKSSEELRSVVETLKAHPEAKAEITGYTDNAGNDAYNLKLSQERAMATMNRIAGMGIDKSRLTAEGYGESRPVADNATAEGRQQNRRVEIRITG
jgi:outer membrane protein OmpA-like peptidoglycan-associated protein